MIDPLDHKTLSAARQDAGLSRAQLAAMSGVDVSTIFRIEQSMTPKLDTWAKIVRVIQERAA